MIIFCVSPSFSKSCCQRTKNGEIAPCEIQYHRGGQLYMCVVRIKHLYNGNRYRLKPQKIYELIFIREFETNVSSRVQFVELILNLKQVVCSRAVVSRALQAICNLKLCNQYFYQIQMKISDCPQEHTNEQILIIMKLIIANSQVGRFIYIARLFRDINSIVVLPLSTYLMFISECWY